MVDASTGGNRIKIKLTIHYVRYLIEKGIPIVNSK